MTTSTRIFVALTTTLALAATCVAGQGVSPGRTDAVAGVEARCPTFDWEAEPGASLHELAVYAFPAHLADEEILVADLDVATEVLYQQLPGGATGWTPSGDQCLTPGGRYAWFVRAVAAEAETGLEEAGEWSQGRDFTVPAAPSPEEVARAIEVMRWLEGSSGSGSSMIPSARATATAMGHRTGAGNTKAVPSAPAAIRGDHPSLTGEAYGVVGTSSADEGAGIAAAHLDGGPDLVLDGSVDGEVDTQIWEWGMYRHSPAHQTFEFTNPGSGRLHVDVEGDMTADIVRTEEVVVNGMTVIDDSGDWLGNGSTVPCASCIGTISLDDDAVISRKIQDGQVRTDDLDADAVTTAKIADGTITAADVDPTSSIYVSKSQPYIREHEMVLPSGPWTLQATCDDENDLPLTGWCDTEASPSAVEIVRSRGSNWTSPVLFAGWSCGYDRINGSGTTGTATIVCIPVPGP